MSTFVLPLSDSNATLETVGGKGMSLAKLARAGLPVPGGFHVTTDAYRTFVDINGLQPEIIAALRMVDISLPATLETASRTIRKFFEQSIIPAELSAAITDAYHELGDDHAVVAVRSSATAEDLPDASFAGQQETFLNIHGADDVLDAVKKCWASLWTARAIAYRARQNIAPDCVALAVVIQKLVFAESAGIMFTANPVNGERGEIIINAAWGLGEAIVSGAVTPDTITVDKQKHKVIRGETAEKLVMTVRTESGVCEQPVLDHLRKKAVLSNKQALVLARYGEQIESLYGMPMDIEWAWTSPSPFGRGAGSEGFAIVQARPITSLPPEWNRTHPNAMYARGSFAEFVPDAVSPLFATLGIPIARESTLKMLNEVLGKEIPDSYYFDVINGYVYVGIPMTWEVMWPYMKATVGMSKILKTSNERWNAISEKLRGAARQWRDTDISSLSAAMLVDGTRQIFRLTAEAYNVAQSGTIPNATSGEISFCKFYDVLVKRKGDPEAPTLLFGLDNQPLRAEKALFDIATWLCEQSGLAVVVSQSTAEEILGMLERSDEPAWKEFKFRFSKYLEEFGYAIYELDFARPLPMEEPATLIDAIKAYLAGTGGNPYQRQQEADARREKTIAEMTKRLDPLRRRWFLKLIKWAMETAPMRENSIADLGLAYPQVRRLFGELGRRLAGVGAFESADEIYWLQADELDALAARLDSGKSVESHTPKINERKAEWESNRRLTPPLTIPRKTWFSVFFPQNEERGDTIKGFASSAGKITAPACVMHGPDPIQGSQ